MISEVCMRAARAYTASVSETNYDGIQTCSPGRLPGYNNSVIRNTTYTVSRGKSAPPQTMYDKNELSAVDSEYVCQRTTKFRSGILLDSKVIRVHLSSYSTLLSKDFCLSVTF